MRSVYPNNRNSADSVNTVERVLVEKPARGKWKVSACLVGLDIVVLIM